MQSYYIFLNIDCVLQLHNLSVAVPAGDSSKEFDEEIAKEWEYEMLQDSMGKVLNELNRQLEQKEVIQTSIKSCNNACFLVDSKETCV